MEPSVENGIIPESLLADAKRLLSLTRWVELALAVVTAALVAVIAVGVLVNVSQTHKTIEKIDSCTIPGGACYANLIKTGQSGRVALIDYLDCVLLTPIDKRTAATLDACKAKALTPPPVK